MVSVFPLYVDICARDENIDEATFRELVAPCIFYLNALGGAVDKKSCTEIYYPPGTVAECSKVWSARFLLMPSVGQVRAAHLINLYKAIVDLISYVLPDFDVQAEMSEFWQS